MSRRRALFVLLLCACAAAALAPAAQARIIGAGVSAGGVPLAGLTINQAADRLRAELGPAAMADVVVTVQGRRFTLTARRARVRLHTRRVARRAWLAGRDQPPPEVVAAGGGSIAGRSLLVRPTHSRAAVRAFAIAVREATARAPRDATLRMTLRRMRLRPAHLGFAVRRRQLARRINAALADPSLPRTLRAAAHRPRPHVTIPELRRRYGTVLTVDREGFRLRLFKHLRLKMSYPIAVGMAGLDTPAGRYAIANKAVDPAWFVPNSAWAGSLAGQVIPGGAPDNPLKARWLGIADGVGIHGTSEDWSIGSRASHGCIRMHVSDVIDLYGRVPVGTPVLIG